MTHLTRTEANRAGAYHELEAALIRFTILLMDAGDDDDARWEADRELLAEQVLQLLKVSHEKLGGLEEPAETLSERTAAVRVALRGR